MQTNIVGIQSLDALEFTANYNKTDFTAAKALEASDKTAPSHYAVYFGENGTNGKFTFDGQMSVFANGGGVNEVVDMTISIACSTEIQYA